MQQKSHTFVNNILKTHVILLKYKIQWESEIYAIIFSFRLPTGIIRGMVYSDDPSNSFLMESVVRCSNDKNCAQSSCTLTSVPDFQSCLTVGVWLFYWHVSVQPSHNPSL